MRTLMTFVTLGAGCAGYAYLQQTPAAGEPYFNSAKGNTAYEWNRDIAPKSDFVRSPIQDFVNRIHAHTKSILDEFANDSESGSESPTGNAFERLRQVAQSSSGTGSNGDAKSAAAREYSNSRATRTNVDRSLPSTLDELQRIAFQPADPVPVSGNRHVNVNAPTESVDDSPIAREREPSDTIRDSAILVVSEKQESASTTDRSQLTATDDAVPTGVSVSPDQRTNSDQIAERTLTTAKPASTISSNSNSAGSKVGEWKVIGKTTEGRPMHSMHLGNRGTRTLVIAGLDGEDRFAVRWLEQLADTLAGRPDLLDSNEVVFFRAGNPDGLIQKVTENARGVVLNRNFPSRRYRPTPGRPATAIPAGEIETRVILDTLYSFRPRRVIHLSATTARSQIAYNRLAKDIARELERSAKVGLTPLDVEQQPGSIEDFSDGTLEAAVLSMRLSIGNDWQKAWASLQPRVLSSIVGRLVDAAVAESQDPDRSPIPNAMVEPVSRNPRRRGYEEIPPPPP